jgi:hypothetical protein
MSLPLVLALVRGLMVQPAPLIPPPNAAVIVNSGSTNITGYQILVNPNGSATYTIGRATPAPIQMLPASTTQTFFHDLAAAQPFNKLPVEHCMTSVSFATKTYIRFQGSVTPDLSCVPTQTAGARLYQDSIAITQWLHVFHPAARGERRLL